MSNAWNVVRLCQAFHTYVGSIPEPLRTIYLENLAKDCDDDIFAETINSLHDEEAVEHTMETPAWIDFFTYVNKKPETQMFLARSLPEGSLPEGSFPSTFDPIANRLREFKRCNMIAEQFVTFAMTSPDKKQFVLDVLYKLQGYTSRDATLRWLHPEVCKATMSVHGDGYGNLRDLIATNTDVANWFEALLH